MKKLLFSVTKEDCRWDYFRCPGPGGQHVNKASTGVRCTHPPSGAVGQSCELKSQIRNKTAAFQRMAETKEFKTWHRMEVARRTGVLERIEKEVAEQMNYVKVEVKNENGLWIEVNKYDTLEDKENGFKQESEKDY